MKTVIPFPFFDIDISFLKPKSDPVEKLSKDLDQCKDKIFELETQLQKLMSQIPTNPPEYSENPPVNKLTQ